MMKRATVYRWIQDLPVRVLAILVILAISGVVVGCGSAKFQLEDVTQALTEDGIEIENMDDLGYDRNYGAPRYRLHLALDEKEIDLHLFVHERPPKDRHIHSTDVTSAASTRLWTQRNLMFLLTTDDMNAVGRILGALSHLR